MGKFTEKLLRMTKQGLKRKKKANFARLLQSVYRLVQATGCGTGRLAHDGLQN